MLRVTIYLFLLIASASVVLAEVSRSNEYGEARAWFNNTEVTAVKKEQIKAGDPFEVRVMVSFTKDAEVSVSLSASGFRGGSKQPFAVVEGPSQFDKAAGPIPKSAGENVDLRWKLKATDTWTGGSVPINAGVSFSETKPPYRGDSFSFTIANIYISPAGSAPASAASTPRQPGFEVAAAIAALGVVGAAFRRLTK